ncbi:hypothetical protein [Membranihabitans maritimus]|uniref:hypothetical protein n=1 Tax=Membranihabitans maritimus TaxID=2904244 RepID=UPI001F2DC325|nr:hypothetical protein [Membranihabitans maritimus]
MVEALCNNMITFILHIALTFIGISYLYWTILAFLIAIIYYIVRLRPLTIPKNPKNWIVKKYIFDYSHSLAWLSISWMFFKMWKNGNNGNWFTWGLGIIALLLFLVFSFGFIQDRMEMKRLRETLMQNN